MRLFIAVNFPEPVKDKLEELQGALRWGCVRGNFSRKPNLHLTLVFLGEVPGGRVKEIRAVMDAVRAAPFSLVLHGLGCFDRDSGGVWWIGADGGEGILRLHEQLCSRLKSAGFGLERRAFKPHLTLAREVSLSDGFDTRALSASFAPIETEVAHISLMRSERTGCALTYTELYKKSL